MIWKCWKIRKGRLFLLQGGGDGYTSLYYFGKDWKDIAVFKYEDGKVVLLPVESNEFRGERLNRATWSQLVWLKSFGVNKAELIDEKDANFC